MFSGIGGKGKREKKRKKKELRPGKKGTLKSVDAVVGELAISRIWKREEGERKGTPATQEPLRAWGPS